MEEKTEEEETEEEEEQKDDPIFITYNRPLIVITKAMTYLDTEEEEDIEWRGLYTLLFHERKVAKKLTRKIKKIERQFPHLLGKGSLPPQDIFIKAPSKTKTRGGLTRTIFYNDRWERLATKHKSVTRPVRNDEIEL